jgi:hypothetical protein
MGEVTVALQDRIFSGSAAIRNLTKNRLKQRGDARSERMNIPKHGLRIHHLFILS